MIRRTITAHISPYFGGLAPETHDFVRHLNEEAKRLRTGVSFIALANRILAHGNLYRATKVANTLGARLLRRAFADGFIAHQPQPRWETLGIKGEEVVLRRGNSQHRKELRRREKNRPQKKEYRYPRLGSTFGGFQHGLPERYLKKKGLRPRPRPSDNIALGRLHEIANGTFYQLVSAIPLEERDRLEIYPSDFSTALIPLPQRTNWPAERLARWRRQGRLLCGVSSNALLGRDSLGLRDYSGPARLLFRSGRYELVSRQKAASAVRYVLTITSEFVDLPAIEPTLALYAWQRLTPPKTQYVLKRDGRLYKNSCWWSKKEKRCLFDKAWASSGKKLSWAADGNISIRPDPADPVAITKREAQQNRREGGRVMYLGHPAKRYANLARTRAAYNEQYESYLNSTGLGKRLRRSLNIPRETIEVRNNMIENLKNDFGRDEATVA